MTEADRLLRIDPLDADVFTATIAPRRGVARLFGGQVAAQALLAACRTVDHGRPPHSLHGYFVRAGRPDVPLRYDVDRTRDGRSLTTRHVAARQEGATIFELLASFQQPETGASWQAPAPSVGPVPPPREVPPHPLLGHLRGHLDVRRVDENPVVGWQIHPFWVRASPAIGDDPVRNAAMLTYVSDIALMAGAREPGTHEPMAVAASLDHAVWFHRPPQVDDWLLFATEPVAHIGTRGMVRGSFRTTDGLLVASVTQEALLRPARAV